MEISVKSNFTICELKVTSGGTTIVEDVAVYGHNRVADSQIETLLTAAFNLFRYNNVSDVEFMREMLTTHLSSHEREEFISSILKDYDN